MIPATGHNYGAMDFVAVTCETPASVGIKCTACEELKAGAVVITAENQAKLLSDLKAALGLDDTEDADAITELTNKVKPAAATGHDWERDSSIEPTSTTPATCYAAGKKVYTCEDCKKETEVEIPKREHDYKETYHDADCLNAGYMEITCNYDDCDYSEEDHDSFAAIDPALDHDLEDVAQKDATCIAKGHASGQRCKRTGCDYVVGCEEIDEDTVTGHVWNEGVEQGDDICTNGGTLLKTCTLCNTATKEETIAPGHKWVRKTIKNEETGKTMAIVKGCDREGCNAISEYLYMPKGYGYCPTHELVEITEENIIPAVAPTCTEAGTTEGKRCPLCPEDADPIQEPQEVPATGHTYKEDKVIEAAKCNAPGKKAKVCSVCNETYDEEVIPATGEHEYEDVLVDATCQSNAFVKSLCTGCKAENPDREPIEIEGTIDENAHKYNGTECTECHKPMPEGYAHCEEHGWVLGTVITGTAASCTQTGLTDGLKCPTCQEVIKEQVEIPMTDHTYTKWVEVTPATCKDAGEEKQVCAECDHESGETREIPKTDTHDYDEEVIAGTCISPDKIVMVCKVCGKQGDTVFEGDADSIDPDAHKFVEGVCEYCHKSAEELEGYVECESDGWVKGQLVRGKAPTCKETGLTDGIKCPTCQTMLVEQTVLDKTDEHTFGEWVTLTPATCKDAGTKIAKCSVCEQQYGDEEEIPSTGEHSYTVEGMIAGTCSANAFITFSCSGCGQEDENLRQEVNDTKDPDNHTYERTESAATCTEDKKVSYICSGCGQEDPERPAEVVPGTAGHTFGEWVEKKAPTCAEAGAKIAKCSVCGEEYGEAEEIPATGKHSYTVEKTVTEATCTANAVKGYFCAVCDAEDESKRVEVPGTAGHVFEGDSCKGCGIKNAAAVTTGTGSVISGTNRVTLRSDISVADKDAEIVEMGVLYITAKAYNGDAKSDLSFALAADGSYTISNSSVRVQKYTSADADLTKYDNVYVTINLGTDVANTTRTLYGRGYIIVKKDGKYSVQFDSNVVKGTYADGFSAM